MLKKIIIVGMGAIGASFASQMKDQGVQPIVMCDEKRKARYTKDGFIINDTRYDFEYITPAERHLTADLVIVVVKYHHLNKVVDQIQNIVDKNTVIMSLMNGIDSEQILGERYGMEKMVHAFVVALDGVREKNQIRFTSPGQIIFGNDNGEQDHRTDCVKDTLEVSGINYKISEDILKQLWWKFMVNVGANQVSAILKTPYGAMKHSESTKILLRSAMNEVIAISEKMDIGLDASSIDDFFGMIDKLSDEGITSMHQDVLAHRKTEVEMLAGQVIAMGERFQVPTPVNEILFQMITTIEFLNKI